MLIHSKPSASIQEFARAFGLKKDRFAAAFFLEGLNRTVRWYDANAHLKPNR